MTVKELFKTAVCDIGLSFFEDPSGRTPELLFRFRQGDIGELDVLSKDIQNSEVHLMTSENGIIHATVWNEEQESDK